MSFRDDILSDIETVYENEEEFMTKHEIDGQEMLASVDDMELLRRDKKGGSNVDGIYKKRVLLFVSKKSFGKLPAVNRIVTLDKKKYLVKEAHNEDGMYSILLEVAKS